MKKSFKKVAALFMVSAMALSTVACGSSTKSSEATSNETASSTTATETKTDTTTQAADSEEPVTIKITWWGGDTRHEYTQKLLDLYTQEHPNVTFEALPAGWDGYFDKLSTQAASGSMPDIVQMDYLYISTYAKNNSIADLQQFIDDGTIDTKNIDANILNTGKIKDKMAGIALSTSILAVTCNPDVIAAAGAQEPDDKWTWDDYIALNTKVAGSTGQPSALAATGGAFGDTNLFNYWVRQHGGVLFNEDGTDLGFTDDTITADYFQMWKDMADANVAPDADEQSQIASLGAEALPVVTGTAATSIDWNNATSRTSSINDKLKLAMMPSSSDSNALWLKPGMFFSVSESSKVKKECAEFINWFINSDEANMIIAGERGTPVSSTVRETMIGKGNLNEQQMDMFNYVDKATMVAGATPAPDPSGIAEIKESFANAGNSVLYGQVTAKEAAATFRTEAKEILERNNAQ